MQELKAGVVDLGEGVAIIGNRILIFLSKKEFNSKKGKGILHEIERKEDCNCEEGLCARADERTLSITFLPTMRCNLRCIYCYSDGGWDNRDLCLEDALYVIDQLLKEYPQINKVNLYFAGGGEPLLNFSLIREVVNYLKDKYLKTHIRIVTNGTLILDYIDWLKKNDVYLRISYDGSSHFKTRPGFGFNSEEKIVKTLNTLKDEYPPDKLSVQMTITKFNVLNIPTDVVTLSTLYGIRTVKIEPVQTSCSERSKIVDSPDPLLFSKKMISLFDMIIKEDIEMFIDTSYLSIPSNSYFCSLRNKIVVSPYGLLTPCVEIVKEGVKDDLILWKIDKSKDINFSAIREVQMKNLFKFHYKNYPVCSQCNLSYICKGNCPMRMILRGGLVPYEYNCSIARNLIPEFLNRAYHDERYLKLVFGNSFSVHRECV